MLGVVPQVLCSNNQLIIFPQEALRSSNIVKYMSYLVEGSAEIGEIIIT